MSIEERLRFLEQRRNTPPIWDDSEQPLARPLASMPSRSDGPGSLRALIPMLGETVQSRCLAQLDESEIDACAVRDSLPLPNPDEREGYWHDQHAAYWLSGLSDYLFLSELIAALPSVDGCPRVLDFGCASGRVLRHFHCQSGDYLLFGTDINRRNIKWIRAHLPAAILGIQNAILPPVPFADCSLDFIYAHSVFTHINDFEEAWLMELHRVLKPGGKVFITFHSERTWGLLSNPDHFMLEQYTNGSHAIEGRPDLDIGTQLFAAPMPADRVVLYNTEYPINNVNVFHKLDYVRGRWGRVFDIEELVECAHGEHQEGMLARKS